MRGLESLQFNLHSRWPPAELAEGKMTAVQTQLWDRMGFLVWIFWLLVSMVASGFRATEETLGDSQDAELRFLV